METIAAISTATGNGGIGIIRMSGEDCFKKKKKIFRTSKNNKINTISKVRIIIQEIKNRKEKSEIKYLNPIIIGTLFLIIWEIAVERLTENIGFWDMLPIAVISVIVLSVVIGWISKEIIEDRKIFNQFERYRGNKRLEELLLEVALKCKK